MNGPVIRRTSPQIAQPATIPSIMLDVIVALIPALLMAGCHRRWSAHPRRQRSLPHHPRPQAAPQTPAPSAMPVPYWCA